MKNEHVVVVIGGAVAGSEAVFQLREKGIEVICVEQNPLPYGKIEDGLPRWHVEQRKKEEEKIDSKLDHEKVSYVPKIKLGKDIFFDEIYNTWKPSALLLANGAWKDRSLGMNGIDQYVGKGLLYQNPLVYWFNHYTDPHYVGPKYEIPDNIIVIGGGLASLDVMKICQLELVKEELRKRKIQTDSINIEKDGIPAFLEKYKLTWDQLGLKGTTLYYRRRVQDMPLAEIPPEATPEQVEKHGALRTKILSNFQTKFLFKFQDSQMPTAPIVENGKLVGLKFVQTKTEGKKALPIPGSEKEVRSNLVIGSVGSIPDLIPGIPQKGETYDVKDIETGEIKGMPGLYALGNAVTGKGNIRVSLMHGRQVSQHVISELKPIESAQKQLILKRVKELQKKSGYSDCTYKTWVEKQLSLR